VFLCDFSLLNGTPVHSSVIVHCCFHDCNFKFCTQIFLSFLILISSFSLITLFLRSLANNLPGTKTIVINSKVFFILSIYIYTLMALRDSIYAHRVKRELIPPIVPLDSSLNTIANKGETV